MRHNLKYWLILVYANLTNQTCVDWLWTDETYIVTFTNTVKRIR